MSKLILVRHGQSEWNLENRFTGWVDVDLAPKGKLEACKAGELIKEKKIKFDYFFTSYEKRAIKTLKLILNTLRIKDNEIIEISTIDSSGGQLNQESTLSDVSKLDFSKVNPVTGPLFVEDALPGDVLEVEIIDFNTSGWGWTANIPGFGLLSDQFKSEAINIWKYDSLNPKSSMFSNFAKSV